jgi:hypothetical protein
MTNFDNSHPQLFTHPACSCGPVIELVKKSSESLENFQFKEISLKNPEGRNRAFEVGVKIIPSLWFPDGTILVGSEEITLEYIKKHL